MLDFWRQDILDGGVAKHRTAEVRRATPPLALKRWKVGRTLGVEMWTEKT